MRRAVIALGVFGCVLPGLVAAQEVGGNASGGGAGDRVGPLTVAERTGFRETGRGADVEAFFEALNTAGQIETIEIGETFKGDAIEMYVLGAPLLRRDAVEGLGPEEALRTALLSSEKPRVLLFGNIHSGETCGKEALQMLARDLLRRDHGGLLDEVILLLIPNYNADGNDDMAADNRPGQDGPVMTGTRRNAQGLDLNRDWVKADAPETRAMIGVFNDYDPLVVVDTHTTNGSLHRHVLTYQGPKHPAGDAGLLNFVRDEMLPAVDEAFEARHGKPSFFYGNFTRDYSKWVTYPAEPRYGVAYRGLRNQISILTEAYAYETFESRVRSTYDFCLEVLNYTVEHQDRMRAVVRTANDRTVERGAEVGDGDRIVTRVRVEAFEQMVTLPGNEPILGEEGERPKPGAAREYEVEFVNRFVEQESATLPYAYVFPFRMREVAENLLTHGVQLERLVRSMPLEVEQATITKIERARGEYEGRRRVENIEADVETVEREVERGAIVVRTAQPLGTLAAYLLEHRSTDGLAAWGFMDRFMAGRRPFPVLRVMEAGAIPTVPLTELPPVPPGFGGGAGRSPGR